MKIQIDSRAHRSFLLYWKPSFADEVLESGRPLCHVGSNQFRRISQLDELWIVTSRLATELSLTGHFFVSACTDLVTVRKLYPHDEIWPARHQVITDTPEAFRDIDITSIATTLRFLSKRDRLIIRGGRIDVQQLRTMRQLSDASAIILRRIWKQHKIRSARVSAWQRLLG